ncbi:fibronectin type III domain-containing protein [Apibacter muscae]|uniref:fibronectin type III domain-containing protein n=1 Tax=Apibacter muscae TaxID=2509004 RepID=UPI0016294FCE|nr:fibronectin type III domain-containing protein [Apibacter muscae]
MDLPTMNTLYKENKKKQSQRKNILFFLFFLYGFIQAQVYPVQVNHYYVPPYSPQLSDYALSTENKFTLRLLMQDIHVVNRKVKLKLYIEGSGFKAVSQDYVVGAPDIYLTGGVMQEFSSIDLRAYFEFQNLQGINSAQYSRPLNEGMYLFSWEVYDFLTNEKLSQKSTVPLYIVQNEPPLLNLPVNGENIQERTPQNLIFQWMPRHINAPNTRYLFQLRELWDNQIDPRAAFLSSPDYYTQETYGTTLLYTMANPSLIPGKTYAWRVQAVSSNGLSENHVFKNNGYSEIYYFTYSTGCETPTFLLSEALSSQRVKLYWQGRPQHHKYHVQYRKKGNPRAEWFDVYTQNNQVQVSELEPGATYEFRVGGTCEPLTGLTQHYTYSGLQQFTLPEKKGSKDSSYNCGIQPEIKITNKNPLLNLAVNESFSAGDFTVKVKQVSGQNGVYNGTGYITVPYFADTRIAVEFRGIQINTDYQLFSGVINTTYDPSWGGMSDVGTLTGEGRDGKNDIEVNFPVKEIIVQGDKILIIGENGETVEYPLGKDYQLVDSNGKVYTIDEKGNVTEGGILSEAGASNPKTTEGVDAKGSITQLTAQGIRVSFTQASDSRYAFDAVEKNDPEEVRKNYKKIDPNYYLPYKAVKNGNTDYLLANVVLEDTSVNADSLIFRTQDGVAIKSEKISSGQYKLTLEGRFNNAEEEVQAIIKQKGKYQTAGAFILVHITDQEPARVVLVKLDKKAQLPASQELEKYLNQVYHPAGGIFTVGESLDLSEVLSLEGNTITTDKSGALAQYTEQQQQINQKVRELPEFDPSTYYLLITEKSASSGEIGFMPLGRQFGYVFKNSNLRTYAHELGHGVYSLKHPQEVPQGKTDLLMDYGQGTKLSRQDWTAIQNPQLHIGWFDDKNEGAAYVSHWISIPYLEKGIRYIYYFSYYDFKSEKYSQLLIEVWDEDGKRIEEFKHNSSAKTQYEKKYGKNGKWIFTEGPSDQLPSKATKAINFIIERNKEYRKKSQQNKEELVKKVEEVSLKEKLSTEDITKLIKVVNATDLNELKQLNYTTIIAAFNNIQSQKTLKENSENALLKLIKAITLEKSQLKFLSYLEENNNKVLLHLLDELNDRSINPWDNNNFTHFINLLIKIYNSNPNFYKDRFGEIGSSKLQGQIINLNPKPFSDIETVKVEGKIPYLIKFNSFRFRGELTNNKIKIYQQQLISPNVVGHINIASYNTVEDITELNLLDPVLITGDKELPLVAAALDGNFSAGKENYLVPAVFLAYQKEKEFQDLLSKYVMTTLDVATIATSGGTALATKVHWVKRSWALLEVAGAIGNIGVNTTAIDPNSNAGRAVQIYNSAMVLIAVKNTTQGVVSFTKSISPDIRKLLESNLSLRKSMDGYFEKWLLEYEKAIKEGKFVTNEKKLLEEQAQAWKILGYIGKLENTIYKNVKYEDFILTVSDFAKGQNANLAKQSYKLWGEEKWEELYKLFKENNLNDGWPPFNGTKSILKIEKGNQLSEKVFDRFQGPGKITGTFASPVYGKEGISDLYFTYDSRALKWNISEGTNYIKFKFKSNVPESISFEYGDVIPWFGKQGLGEQVKSSQELSKLFENGIIEIVERMEYRNGKWINIK